MARSGIQARSMADKPAAAAAAAPAGPTSIEMTEDGIAIITMNDLSERVSPALPAALNHVRSVRLPKCPSAEPPPYSRAQLAAARLPAWAVPVP